MLPVAHQPVRNEVDLPGHGGDDGEPFVMKPSLGNGKCVIGKRTAKRSRRSRNDIAVQEFVPGVARVDSLLHSRGYAERPKECGAEVKSFGRNEVCVAVQQG